MPRNTPKTVMSIVLGLLEDRGEGVVRTAPEVGGEDMTLEHDDRDDDEDRDRTGPGDEDDAVDGGGLVDPAHDQGVERPHPDTRQRDGQAGLPVPQRREWRRGWT